MPRIVLWAQRADIVYLTVDIADSTPKAEITEDKIDFSATSKEGKTYAFTLEFNKAIDTTVRRRKKIGSNTHFTGDCGISIAITFVRGSPGSYQRMER